MIGALVGHYRITSRIGAGGMGEVYLAHDQRLDRLVALKFLKRADALEGADLLLREARAASALNHPGICTVHEVGESGDGAYIVMEFVEGETLADRIATRPLTPDQAVAVGGAIASALAHAHRRGVVHRDLKSANIVLGPDDRVKILDFGLSRRCRLGDEAVTGASLTATGSGVLAGTPAYMSPEVLRGGRADEHADLWALGVTLYEMCAGRRPFQGATLFDLAAAVLGDDPPALPATVPGALGDVVMRALSKSPAARFDSAAALRDALAKAASGRDPVGPVPGPPPVAPAESVRRPVSPDAYAEYLRGQHAWKRRTVPALRQAIASYERAIDLDPTYALAYAGIAECYGVLGFMGALPSRNAYAPARAAAKRAITLDRSVGAAHIALGYAATHYRWELDLATASFDEGLRLDPDNMNARHWHALLLTSRGDRDGAVAEMRLAIELDPLAPIARSSMGLILYFFGEFEAAAAECRDALDLQPGFSAAEWTLGKVLLANGDMAGALRILRALREASSWTPVLADAGRVLGLAGASDEAAAVLAEMRALSAHTYVRPYDLALVHVGLGDDTAALDELDRAFDEGGNWLNYLRLDPAFAPLRAHTRFTSLLARIAASADGATTPS